MNIHPESRPEEPTDTSNDDAVREYGRECAVDALLRDAMQATASSSIVSLEAERYRKAFPSVIWAAAAACIVALMGVSIWFNIGPGKKITETVSLDARWVVDASIGADYSVVAPDHVKLRRGELRFTSTQPAHLTVETPNAVATAEGTDFFIGHHAEPDNQTTKQPNNKMKTKQMTRMLVLTGIVTLATGQGSVKAAGNEAVVAKADSAPEKIAVQANSRFATNLYAQLAMENPEENMFFSPYSISSALLMTAEGARGQTAKEMGDVLGLPESLRRSGNDAQSIPWEMGKMHTGISALNHLFNRKANPTEQVDTPELKLANALWAEKTCPFLDSYTNTISDTYNTGGVNFADFKSAPEDERLRINEWVEAQTKNYIKDLIPKGLITGDTRFVLANAIYFKGDWAAPFNVHNTKLGDFSLANGKTSKASLMNALIRKGVRYAAFNGDGTYFNTPINRGPAGYPDKDGFSMVELPYRGGEVSMVVIAPNDAKGLGAIEAKLKHETLSNWIGKMSERKVHVAIPKFKSETSFMMKETLASMGMPTAFEKSRADFSGMCSTQRLFVGNVVHKAFVEVSEKGTEAAAATAVVGSKGEASRTFTPSFQADRPFIYLIRDTKTGSILFLGRMMNPGA